MSEELDHLWALHELDEEVSAVTATLDRFPEQRASLERRLETERGRLRELDERVRGMQTERRKFEQDAEAMGAQERKFQSQLPAVKKNEEYTALLHEIATARAKRSDLETEVLLRLEAEEQAMGERPAVEREVKSLEAEVDERMRAIESEEGTDRERLASLEARRAIELGALPAAVRTRYERIHGSREGRAVVPILKGACGGCFRAQPPQVLQEARRRDRLLACEGCGRLLLWPPGAD